MDSDNNGLQQEQEEVTLAHMMEDLYASSGQYLSKAKSRRRRTVLLALVIRVAGGVKIRSSNLSQPNTANLMRNLSTANHAVHTAISTTSWLTTNVQCAALNNAKITNLSIILFRFECGSFANERCLV